MGARHAGFFLVMFSQMLFPAAPLSELPWRGRGSGPRRSPSWFREPVRGPWSRRTTQACLMGAAMPRALSNNTDIPESSVLWFCGITMGSQGVFTMYMLPGGVYSDRNACC